MLQQFLDLGVFADLSDLARGLLAPLGAERLAARFSADGDDPDAVGPSLEFLHQILGQIARRLRQRVDLDIARLEMHQPHLFQQSMLEL